MVAAGSSTRSLAATGCRISRLSQTRRPESPSTPSRFGQPFHQLQSDICQPNDEELRYTHMLFDTEIVGAEVLEFDLDFTPVVGIDPPSPDLDIVIDGQSRSGPDLADVSVRYCDGDSGDDQRTANGYATIP